MADNGYSECPTTELQTALVGDCNVDVPSRLCHTQTVTLPRMCSASSNQAYLRPLRISSSVLAIHNLGPILGPDITQDSRTALTCQDILFYNMPTTPQLDDMPP